MVALLRVPQADPVKDKDLRGYFNEVNRVNTLNFNSLNNLLGVLAGLVNTATLALGYVAIGPLLIEWGSSTVSNGGTVGFPKAFNGAPTTLVVSANGSGHTANAESRTDSGFVVNTSGSSILVDWFAIGNNS